MTYPYGGTWKSLNLDVVSAAIGLISAAIINSNPVGDLDFAPGHEVRFVKEEKAVARKCKLGLAIGRSQTRLLILKVVGTIKTLKP